MNGDDLKPGLDALPPDGGWETKLTARLLGELTEAESKELDAALAADPQLVSLQERLRRMVGYVREVAADPAEPAQGTTALPRMAPGRREQLLEKLRRGSEVRVENHAEGGTESETPAKTVIPVEFPAENAPSVRAGGNRWLALAACLVGLLLATTFLFEGVLPARNAAFSPSTGESAERDRWFNWRFSKAMPTEARFGQRTAEPQGSTAASSVAPVDTATTSPTPSLAEDVAQQVAVPAGNQPELRSYFGTRVATANRAGEVESLARSGGRASGSDKSGRHDYSNDSALDFAGAAHPAGPPAPPMEPQLMRRYGLVPARPGLAGAVSSPMPTLESLEQRDEAKERSLLALNDRLGDQPTSAPSPEPQNAPSAALGEVQARGGAVLAPVLRYSKVGDVEGFGLGNRLSEPTPQGDVAGQLFGGGGGGAGGGGAPSRGRVMARGIDSVDAKQDLGSEAKDSFAFTAADRELDGRKSEVVAKPETVNLGIAVDGPVVASRPAVVALSKSDDVGPPLEFTITTSPKRGVLAGTAPLQTNRAATADRSLSLLREESLNEDRRDNLTVLYATPAPSTPPLPVFDANVPVLGDAPVVGKALNGRAVEDEVLVAGAKDVAFRLPTAGALGAAGLKPEADVSESIEDVNAVANRGALKAGLESAKRKLADAEVAPAPAAVVPPAPVPQPEVVSAENSVSTFSLNVSDVSFKLAGASLENGQLPGPSTVRTEEFLNAFHYRDPDPAPGRPVAFAWERAQFPFAQQRDVMRFSVRTGASGREAGRPLNVVLLLDSSGSMERADRVSTIREALRVLGSQMMPQDRVSVVTFARTARLWIDGLPGDQASNLADRVGELTPEGGTHLEDALRVGYDTARKHFSPEGVNRLVLMTDGAANLGELRAEALRQMVESNRKRGVALDCFGIGFDGYQDDLLEALSRNGDGRYGFVNSPEEAATGFANQLAGALQVAAADVKVQVEFNPQRVKAWRQIGYAKHQLTQEQFRDNTVDAAEIGAAESGNALYVIEPNARGNGPIGTVRVRFRDPASGQYSEQEWAVPYEGAAAPLEQASPALRLATSAAALGEMLSGSPYASEVTSDRLITLLQGVPESFSPDPRPEQLVQMVRQTQSILGR